MCTTVNGRASSDASGGVIRARRFPIVGWVVISLGALVVVWLAWVGLRREPDPWLDFFAFYDSARAARMDEDLYAVGPGAHYIYPPTLAVLMIPWTFLEPGPALMAWVLFCTALIPLSAFILARWAAGALEPAPHLRRLWSAAMLGVVLFAETFKMEMQWANCNLLVILAVALGLAWLDRRPWAAGVALAFGASIKYLPIVFLPYLLVRGRWRAAGAMVLGLAGWLALPALWLGWARTLEFHAAALRGLTNMVGLRTAGPAANVKPMSGDFSVSITSAAARLGERLGWGAASGVAVSAGVGALFLLGVALIYRSRSAPLLWHVGSAPRGQGALSALECTGLLVAAVVFSPQAMYRHFNILLPLGVVLATLLLGPAGPRRRWAAASCAILVLLGTTLPGLEPFEPAIAAWKRWGGRSLAMVAAYLVLLAGALPGREGPTSEPVGREG